MRATRSAVVQSEMADQAPRIVDGAGSDDNAGCPVEPEFRVSMAHRAASQPWAGGYLRRPGQAAACARAGMALPAGRAPSPCGRGEDILRTVGARAAGWCCCLRRRGKRGQWAPARIARAPWPSRPSARRQ